MASLKRRTALGIPKGNGLVDHGRSNYNSKTNRLTAGGNKDDDDDGHSLMFVEEGDSRSDGIQMTNLNKQKHQPTWVVDVDQVKSILQDIRRQMEDLRSLHASRVGSVFGKDLDDMEVQIENMTREVTDKFRRAERILKQVGA